jgi:hypothetical protein
MFVKSKMAIAAALIVGAASVAMAADDDQKGGFRELGPGGTVKDGVNPADHPSLGGARPSTEPKIQTEGRGRAVEPGPSAENPAFDKDRRNDNDPQAKGTEEKKK